MWPFMSQKFVRYGLTSVHHDEPGVLNAMQEQLANGKLLCQWQAVAPRQL
jgi:hypothetical protein